MGSSAPIRLRQDRLAEIARAGIPVPTYDRARLEPSIVHVGVGGFHRAHLAVYAHELASQGSGWGIVGLGLLPQDARMAEVLGAQDHLYTLLEKGNGEPAATVVMAGAPTVSVAPVRTQPSALVSVSFQMLGGAAT